MQRSIQCILIGKRSADETELPASTSSSAKRQSQFAAGASSMRPSDSEEEENVWLDDGSATESEGDDDNLQPPVIDVDSVAVTCEAQAKQRPTSKLINKPLGPSDISAGRTDEPRQPKLSTFPRHNLAKRDGLSRPDGKNCIHGLSIQLVRMQHSVSVVGCSLAVPGRTMSETTFTLSG